MKKSLKNKLNFCLEDDKESTVDFNGYTLVFTVLLIYGKRNQLKTY